MVIQFFECLSSEFIISQKENLYINSLLSKGWKKHKMKKLFFFEDPELEKLYEKGVHPNKRILREKGFYLLALVFFLFLDAFLKMLYFSRFSEDPSFLKAIPLLVKCILCLIIFGFYYFIQTYEIHHLKNLFFADTFYFCLSVITLIMFTETEISLWKEFPDKSHFFFEGMKISLIEFTFLFCFFNWKVKFVSLCIIGVYVLIRIKTDWVVSILNNVSLLFLLLIFILFEERAKRQSFIRLNENMRDLTKEKTVNSRITLINEKERSAISDKILDTIQEGVLVLDIESNIIKMNEPLIKTFKDLKIDINDIVQEVLNAKIVTFIEAPDFILNQVSPSEVHLSPDMKSKLCNHKEKMQVASSFKKGKARTSHIFQHFDFGNNNNNNANLPARRKSRVSTIKPRNTDADSNTLTSKFCGTSNQSQCSSKNQGLNMPVKKAIEILGERVVFFEEKEAEMDLMTVQKNEDNYRINCDIFLEKLAENNRISNKDVHKYKFHLNIGTTSFRDELRFIFILREKRSEIEIRHLTLQNENKTKTLSFVSHEMRTPLNCIVGMLTVLEGIIDTDLVDKYVAPAIACGKHLMNLLNDLLDAAQIQAGKFKLVFVEFDLKSLLSDILFMINIQAKPKGLELVLEWDNNLSHYVKSDPNRIRQIVINLLGNALKFTQKGSIHIVTEKNLRNNTLIHLKVIDTGLGIKEDSKRKLFTAFGKLDQDENEYLNSQGVGLGLLISNILAKNVGPSLKILNESDIYLNLGLNVTSEYGKGTQFEFIIENKNETDLFDEGDVQNELSELNARVRTEEAYFLNVYGPRDTPKETPKDIIGRNRKRFSIKTQKFESECDIRKISGYVIETDPMSSSKSSYDQNQNSEKLLELREKSEMIKKCLSKSKEEIESGKSLYYMSKDFDRKTLNTHNLLNDMVMTRASRYQSRNLFDMANNEEKIHILAQLNKEKKCTCPDFLICDDSQFNIVVLKAMLEVYCFRVDFTFDGDDALKKVVNLMENSTCCRVYKLIFMDIEMPIKNGYDSSRDIFEFFRKNEVECPQIIATTGHDTNKENKKIIEAGMSDVLVKPILKGALVDMLVQKLFNLEKYSPSIYPNKGLSRVSDKILEIK